MKMYDLNVITLFGLQHMDGRCNTSMWRHSWTDVTKGQTPPTSSSTGTVEGEVDSGKTTKMSINQVWTSSFLSNNTSVLCLTELLAEAKLQKGLSWMRSSTKFSLTPNDESTQQVEYFWLEVLGSSPSPKTCTVRLSRDSECVWMVFVHGWVMDGWWMDVNTTQNV